MGLMVCFIIAQLDAFLDIPVPGEWENFGEVSIYSTSKCGIYSPCWNPANCSFTGHHLVSLEVFTIQTNFVNEYLWGKKDTMEYLDEKDKENIIQSIKGNYYIYKNVFEKKIISINYKNCAFTYTSKAYWFSEIPKDFFSWLLFGNELGKRYNLFGGTRKTQNIDEYGLSVSFPSIKRDKAKVSSGIRLKYLRGISCANIDSTCGIVETTWDTIINTSALFASSASGGNGFGIDVGIAGRWQEKIYAGICIENLYSIINWSENTIGEKWTSDTDEPWLLPTIENTYAIPTFKSRLPLFARMAISYDFGITKFISTAFFGQYWAHSVAISLKTWKYTSIMGGIRYSFFGLSPIFEIEIVPISNLRLSGGYHRRKGGLLLERYKSGYSLALSGRF